MQFYGDQAAIWRIASTQECLEYARMTVSTCPGSPYAGFITDFNLSNRPHLPPQVCGRLRPRSREKALTIGQDGEERYAQHGARL